MITPERRRFVPMLALAAGALSARLAAQESPDFEDILKPAPVALDSKILTSGDIDGDGLADVALVRATTVMVWRGTPEGLSSTSSVLGAPVALRTGRLADLDDDGLADLVLLAETAPEALVAWSQGDGTFAPFQLIALPTHGGAVAVADVTGDGHADLLASHFGYARLAIVPGLGNHQFGPEFDTHAPSNATRLELGDIDADGALDLLSKGGDSPFSVDISTSLGDGAGHFAPPTPLFQGGTGTMAVFMDVDRDGRDDVVLGNGTGSVQWLAGQPDGSLAPPVLLASLPGISGLAVGDVTGDALPDLLVSSEQAGTRVLVLRQTGTGLAFDTSATAYVFNDLEDLTATDVDGDGVADAISRQQLTESLGALLAQQGGGFRNGFVADVLQRDVLVLDADGDGHPDLLAAVDGAPSGRRRAGQPNGAFGPLTPLDLGASPRLLFGGDADLDGDLDVLVVQDTPVAGARWLLNDGNGAFTAHATTTVAGSFRGAAADDLDGDGRLDVVITTLTPTTLAPLLTAPGGTLVARPAVATSFASNELAAGDFDGSGWHDVALISGSSVQVLRLQPVGEPISTILPLAAPGQDVVLGNLDGDGLADILVSTKLGGQSGISWIENDGSGTPTIIGEFPLTAGYFTGPLGLGDADGDGFGELLLGGTSTGFNQMCAILHSHGGPLKVDELHPLPAPPARCGLADADGDGALDLVILGDQNGPVLVLPNAGHTWKRLGHSLAGGAGLSRLEGTGALVAGEPAALRVEGALPSAAGILVVGVSVLEAPFKGGVLVPDADLLLAGPLTDADGALTVEAVFPAGVPSGTTIAAQVWFPDGAGPAGYSATWGIAGTSP